MTDTDCQGNGTINEMFARARNSTPFQCVIIKLRLFFSCFKQKRFYLLESTRGPESGAVMPMTWVDRGTPA